jgi:2-polyprenyl-6-methoxyphenol hydroxylase-like FAD-dependent oxidoreductase
VHRRLVSARDVGAQSAKAGRDQLNDQIQAKVRTMPEMYDTPVLIVGAGPVGLALALDMAWRGCRTTIVESEPDIARELRAKASGLDERSLEHFRRWGLHERVTEVGFPMDYPGDTLYCTSMNGLVMGRSHLPPVEDEVAPFGASETRNTCPQWELDKLLVQAVADRGLTTIRCNAEFDTISQDAEGVTTQVVDPRSGIASVIRSRYVVACDGAGSAVRRHLGIPFEGRQLDFSLSVTVRIHEMKLPAQLASGQRYLLIDESGVWGIFTFMDGREIWRLTMVGAQDKLGADTHDDETVVRRALGSDDIEFEILRREPWRRSQCVAASYRRGRVLLAGDAAHTMSPTGGHGLNTGIGDVSDLGWMLEAVLTGWAGDGLLDAYGQERRPVGLRNGLKATSNYGDWVDTSGYAGVMGEGPEGDVARARTGQMLIAALASEWHSPGTALGFRYEGSPVIVADDTPEPPDNPVEYVPTTRPGHRAPHVALGDGRSILTLFGRGFVLLRNGAVDLDTGAFEVAAAALGVPLRVEDIDGPGVAALYERKLVLVRPDGHVAWRSDTMPEDPAGILNAVRGA